MERSYAAPGIWGKKKETINVYAYPAGHVLSDCTPR